MNIDKLQGDPNNQLQEGSGEIEEIGILNLYNRSIKYTYNHIGIYANGNLFCSTFNDKSTAVGVFIESMKAAFGDQFKTVCQ